MKPSIHTLAPLAWCFSVLLLSSCHSSFFSAWRASYIQKNSVQWIALNVSKGALQADANLLRFDDGTTVLIDAGEVDGNLCPSLRRVGVRELHRIYVSHPHKDHYIGIRSLLAQGFKIGSVFLNMPEKKECDREIPWGCDWEDLHRLRSELQTHAIPIYEMHPGQKLEERSGATLEILFAFTAKSRPKGLLDFTINDQSTVLRLTYAPTSVLFTGDLNLFTGKYLAENAAPALPATILKVPHHGTENTVPDAFFKTVGAKLAIVPSPKGLWLSERSKRIRSVLATTPTLVTEEVGNIVVTLDKDGFSHYFFK